MKADAKKIFLNVLIFPVSFLIAFGARIFSLYIMGVLFEKWNLTETTFSYAPLWAQRLVLMSGDIADLCFLVFLVLALFLYSGKKRICFSKTHLIYPAFGVALSVLTVGVLLLIGSARMPKIRVFPFFGASLLYVLTDFFAVTATPYLARKVPGRMFSQNAPVRVILSVLIQAAFWVVSKNSLSVVFILNACLSGLVLWLLYEKTQSVLSEILIVFSFRFFTRFVFGFPDLGGAYPVSEALLTGAMGGVSHSLLLSVYLLVILVFLLRRSVSMRTRRKGESHVSP